MKTFFTLSLHLLLTSFLCAQAPQGIPYQAVMRNPDGSVMASSAVDLTFMIHDGSATGTVVYQESHSLTSNTQGLVSCVVGNGVVSQGNFANINWGSGAKFLHVMMGTTDLGTQQMLSVPYALHSASADSATNAISAQTADNGFSNVSQTGDTLYMANGNYIIVPGISAANYPAPVLGCTNVQACNYNAAATQDDGSCLYLNATCNDGNANTMNDVIDGNCTCSGVLMVNGCTNVQACNYNPAANVDNGSCLIQGTSCNDGNANTINDVINANCECAGTATGNGVFVPGNGVTDIDGTVYTSIIINGQEWMQQNLAVTKYRNGDPIPTGLSNTTWQNTMSGAYAIFNNDAANNTTYGKLYNWYAVNDSRGLCPTGWHVPSDAEWTTLETSLGGSSVAGGKMKSTTGWNAPFTGATNESGFSGLPGGYRYYDGAYNAIGIYGYWWSSTEGDSNGAWDRGLDYNYGDVLRSVNDKPDGFSVRCVRDTEASPILGCTDGSACNFLANATQDDGSCLYSNATCNDGNANTANDVINANCQCAGTLSLSIGQDYQGGKVAYIFQPGDAGFVAGETHGLIATSQDLPGAYPWGCFGTDISGADSYELGTGAQNTVDIVNAGCGGAAQACADLVLNGYDDWFLPSIAELQELYNNRDTIGGFQNSGYWSSSELYSNGAWGFYMDSGDNSYIDKGNNYSVRAVRAF